MKPDRRQTSRGAGDPSNDKNRYDKECKIKASEDNDKEGQNKKEDSPGRSMGPQTLRCGPNSYIN